MIYTPNYLTGGHMAIIYRRDSDPVDERDLCASCHLPLDPILSVLTTDDLVTHSYCRTETGP